MQTNLGSMRLFYIMTRSTEVHVEISQGISDLARHRDGDLRHYGRAAPHVRIVPSVRGGVTVRNAAGAAGANWGPCQRTPADANRAVRAVAQRAMFARGMRHRLRRLNTARVSLLIDLPKLFVELP
jgi:hypothetical protein